MARLERRGECLVFTGKCNRGGYGRVAIPQQGPILAHRLMWEHHNGPIPEGKLIMHSCDNPPCVELAHLSLGTIAENAADMARKGRASRTYGSDNPRTKVTDSDVVTIRLMALLGVGHRSIASQFGIHPAHVSRIVTGRRRDHVADLPWVWC